MPQSFEAQLAFAQMLQSGQASESAKRIVAELKDDEIKDFVQSVLQKAAQRTA